MTQNHTGYVSTALKKAAFGFIPAPVTGITRYIHAEASIGVQMLMGIKMPNQTYMIEMTTRHASGNSNTMLFPEQTFTHQQARQLIDKLYMDWIKNRTEKDFMLADHAYRQLLSRRGWLPSLPEPLHR